MKLGFSANFNYFGFYFYGCELAGCLENLKHMKGRGFLVVALAIILNILIISDYETEL